MKLFSELAKEIFPKTRYCYCCQCKTECIDDFSFGANLICPICNNGYRMHCFITMDELKDLRDET